MPIMKLKVSLAEGYSETVKAWAYRFKAEGDTPELRAIYRKAIRAYIATTVEP